MTSAISTEPSPSAATLAPTFLIYRTGFAPTNGTSVQMQRFWAGAEGSIVHLMWDCGEAGPDSVRWVVRADDGCDWKRPFRRLGRYLRQMKGMVFLAWWRQGRLNRKKMARALSAIPLRPRQAYVTCYNEQEADKAFQLWTAAGRPPFVLHLFDLLHPALSETATPRLVELVRGATHVFCLNRLIEDEARRAGATDTSVFPLVSDFRIARRTAPPFPLKVLMSGALYAHVDGNIAMRLLGEAWPRVRHLYPQAELHYSGTSGAGIPAELRPHVRNHGFLSTDAYERLLQSCHVAYVPVSHLGHTEFRFSIPSRIPDYLIHGLPVLACTDENNALDDFIQSTPRACARRVRTADEFISGLRDFADDPRAWEQASDAAIAFSREAFAVEPARRVLVEKLNAAGAKA